MKSYTVEFHYPDMPRRQHFVKVVAESPQKAESIARRVLAASGASEAEWICGSVIDDAVSRIDSCPK